MITYKGGYKYQLAEEYLIETGIEIPESVETDYFAMDTNGSLIIRKGYAWDGPSGPTWDSVNFIRGSLVHDPGYQMMSEMLIPMDRKEPFDRLLQEICLEDGMSSLRAWYVYRAVRHFGHASARGLNEVREAP